MANQTLPQTRARGVTLDQLDEMINLSRKVEANLNVMSVGGHVHATENSTATIALDCFETMGKLINIINGLAPCPDIAEAPKAAELADRPAFCQSAFTTIVQAHAIVQVINTAAYEADSAEGIGGAAWAVSDMLERAQDYIETTFKITKEDDK